MDKKLKEYFTFSVILRGKCSTWKRSKIKEYVGLV
jgi:hypothetical protein